LLEDEESVGHADGALEEATRRWDARGRVFIDEPGERSFELLVWICELTVSFAAGMMKSKCYSLPLLANGASFLK
jgi:hypothetical protein